jgi:hypothetical protein
MSAWLTGLLLLAPLAGCGSNPRGARTSSDNDGITDKDDNTFVASGNEWLHKKEYDKAIQDYDQAIRLEPKWGPDAS